MSPPASALAVSRQLERERRVLIFEHRTRPRTHLRSLERKNPHTPARGSRKSIQSRKEHPPEGCGCARRMRKREHPSAVQEPITFDGFRRDANSPLAPPRLLATRRRRRRLHEQPEIESRGRALLAQRKGHGRQPRELRERPAHGTEPEHDLLDLGGRRARQQNRLARGGGLGPPAGLPQRLEVLRESDQVDALTTVAPSRRAGATHQPDVHAPPAEENEPCLRQKAELSRLGDHPKIDVPKFVQVQVVQGLPLCLGDLDRPAPRDARDLAHSHVADPLATGADNRGAVALQVRAAAHGPAVEAGGPIAALRAAALAAPRDCVPVEKAGLVRQGRGGEVAVATPARRRHGRRGPPRLLAGGDALL